MMKKSYLFLLILSVCSAIGFCQEEAPIVFRFEEDKTPDANAELLSHGRAALAEHLYPFAIKKLSEYIANTGDKQPDLAVGSNLLATAYIKNGEPDKALDTLIKLGDYSILPIDDDLRCSLLYSTAMAYSLLQKWEDAIYYAIQASSQNYKPEMRHNAILLCADCMMKIQEWSQIIKLLEEYLNAVPQESKNYDIQYRLAEAYIANKDYRKAKNIIDRIDNDVPPQNQLEHKMLCIRNLAMLNEATSALKLFNEIINMMPDSPNEHWWITTSSLADALYQDKRYKEAETVYKYAQKLAITEEDRLFAHTKIIDIYIKLNESPKAKEELARFERDFSQTRQLAELTNALANLLRDNGDNSTAAELFAKLAAYPQTSAKLRYDALMNRGECLHNINYNLAITSFLEAEQQGENDSQKANAAFKAALVAADLFSWARENAPEQDNGNRALELFKSVADRYAETAVAPSARYHQAELLLKQGKFKESSSIYAQFIEQFPNDDLKDNAIFYQGLTMRKGANNLNEKQEAASFLSKHASEIQDAQIAVKTRMEAFRSAEEAGNRSFAESELTMIIDREDLLEGENALFLRAMLRFDTGKMEDAQNDCELFFKRYPQSPKADELCLMLGDALCNKSNMVMALKYYATAANKDKSRNASIYPLALYEAAQTSYNLNDFTNARNYVDELLSLFRTDSPLAPKDNGDEICARAYYLSGEIFSEQREYEKARGEYANCRNKAGDTQLGFAALGRQGEMLLQKAQGNLKNDEETKNVFKDAEKCFKSIITHYTTSGEPSNPLVQLANYRLAVSLKLQKKDQEALEAYQNIYFAYIDKLSATTAVDNFYFANAVLDMADILENMGDADSLQKAKTYYAKLAQANLPVSATAEKRVKIITEKIRKNNY